MSDYTGKSSEDLLAIAKARGLSLRKNASDETIIEALEEDDKETESAAAAIQPPAPLPIKPVSLLPVVIAPDSPTIINPAQPLDDEYTDGIFIHTLECASRGEEFALCVTEPNEYHCTHFLKNTVHFWSGTKSQFKEQFDKK